MTETTAQAPTEQRAAVESYVRFWNAGTPQEQRRLAAEAFTDDVTYYALIGILRGPSELAAFRDEFAGHMGEVAFRPRAEAQILHGRARLTWEIEAGGKRVFAAGTDVLVFAPDGRIASVSAFLDQAPEGFDPQAHH
ncbi:MAG: nuclear transport factor 2 family protein [Actinomycetia bacterium]|nr:nuclear transport factor 2 family protein [Actinomycetes bacterium]